MFERYSKLEFNKLKKFILNCIHDVNGQDIICLDIYSKYRITDLMIICTGQSNRHVISIAQDISKKCYKIGLDLYSIEGMKFGEWILIDLGDIIIHIMQNKMRKLYEIEKLWQ